MRVDPSGEFTSGAIAMLLTLPATVAAVRVAEWVLAHPQPQAMVNVLTAARFSVLDVLGACLFVVVIASAVAATYWLPGSVGGEP